MCMERKQSMDNTAIKVTYESTTRHMNISKVTEWSDIMGRFSSLFDIHPPKSITFTSRWCHHHTKFHHRASRSHGGWRSSFWDRDHRVVLRQVDSEVVEGEILLGDECHVLDQTEARRSFLKR